MPKCFRRVHQSLCVIVVVALCACSKDPNQAKQEYMASGDGFFAEGKFDEAAVQYRNALQLDPLMGEARYKLAETQAKTGDVNAYREYVRAADLLPDRLDIQMKAATLLLLTGQFEDAKARALLIISKDPKNSGAQVLLGNALAGLRDFDSAITQLEDAVKLEPNANGYATLASVQLARGNQPQAEAAFRRAIVVDPSSVNAHLSLANYLWGAGRTSEAEAAFKQSVDLNPRNDLANRGFATFLIYTNRATQAEPYLKVAAEEDASALAVAKLGLADYYLSLNRLDEAAKVLEPLASAKGSFAGASTRLAAIQYFRKQTSAAYTTVDGVLKQEPQNVPALLMKARFLAAEKRYDEALELASAAANYEPNNIETHYAVGMIHLSKGQRPQAITAFNQVLRLNPRAVATQLQLSRLGLAQGETELALRLAQDAASQTPNQIDAQLALARSLIASRNFSRAEPIVRRLVAGAPTVSQVQSTAGVLHASQQQWPAARQEFERAIELDPMSFEALSGLVGVDVGQNRPDAARARVDAQLASQPNNTQIHALSGQLYLAARDLPKAEAAFQKAITVDPNNLLAYSRLGETLILQRKVDQAREQFDRITQADPKAVAAHTMVAMLLEAGNHRAEARQRYEQILQIDGQAAVAANNLANIYADDGGNLDLALQLAQTAKSHLPDRPEVNDTVGWVFLKKDFASLAIPLFREAIAKDGQNPVYQFHLGLAYAKAGDKAKARTSLQQALKLNPSFDGADEAKKVLASL